MEDTRLPRGDKERQQYAQMVGEYGLLALLDASTAPPVLGKLPKVAALRTAWSQQFQAQCISPRWAAQRAAENQRRSGAGA